MSRRTVNFAAILLFFGESFCEVDIFNKCPEAFPVLTNIELKEMSGGWFAHEIIEHYFGKSKYMEIDTCLTVQVDIESESDEKLQNLRNIEVSIKNQNRTSLEKSYTLNEEKYLFKVDRLKQGFWFDDYSRSIHVVMFENNFTVLTLCNKNHLVSFVLNRKPDFNASEGIQIAHDQLERRGLLVESPIALCRGSSNYARAFILSIMLQKLFV